MTKTKKLVYTALCIAIGIVLPMAFHTIPNAGGIFLPMHIPVLICGLICGWPYGLACGIIAPLISSFATGMPPMAILPGMLFELAVYGMVSGLLLKSIRTGKAVIDAYISLVGAMIAGRIVYGVVNALIFRAGEYSMALWTTAAFVTAIPGIVIQLSIIPVLFFTLERAGIIDKRYAKQAT